MTTYIFPAAFFRKPEDTFERSDFRCEANSHEEAAAKHDLFRKEEDKVFSALLNADLSE